MTSQETNPQKRISKAQLSLFNGEDHDRMYIAYNNIVYDVTDCPKWRRGLHEGLHFPGQNLTDELTRDAPHYEEVFNHPCIKIVGRLEE